MFKSTAECVHNKLEVRAPSHPLQKEKKEYSSGEYRNAFNEKHEISTKLRNMKMLEKQVHKLTFVCISLIH